MTVDPKDDLDRVIDEAVASMVAGEPRRVSAATVRQAMGRRRGFGPPVWLAAAAVLIVGLALALKYLVPASKAPVTVTQSAASPAPSAPPAEGSPVPSESPTPSTLSGSS